ncbi:PXMP2/4 family protein 4-like [Portunus trituberculatus]|uniref:PXMP2/4 family protein 4-like n=1 Tax=Portunus trituberculatus TaxID=210409 RepID=UPI001E1CDF41|nr:PXMP2/4 family protein 4-like [Portunus trituberculatus]XP_045127459.1 PXMP2/4 family protein 4-like [Portunus trituberculatus]XP_045127460.1 PXMP2/4 family protein 4-like [Portunus trituberculatus]
MATILKALKKVGQQYPILRGMTTYSVLWPTSNLVQQSMDKTRDKYDIMETLRYLVLGTFVTAPTVHVWVKLASKIIKGTTLKHAVLKAGLEQVLFAPVGQTQFYLGITLLEGRPWDECVREWKQKLIPTWKVAVCFWPVVQTFNFAYVAEKNRVVVVSLASFMWTIFLSYMHHMHQESLPRFLHKNVPREHTNHEE